VSTNLNIESIDHTVDIEFDCADQSLIIIQSKQKIIRHSCWPLKTPQRQTQEHWFCHYRILMLTKPRKRLVCVAG